MFFTVSMLGECGQLEKFDVVDKQLNTAARIGIVTVLGDAFISITALVSGILGLIGLFHGISPATAYALISLSGVITLTWIILTMISAGEVFTGDYGVPALLRASLSSDPEFVPSLLKNKHRQQIIA